MIDWAEVSKHVEALGIGSDETLKLAFFPPKPEAGEKPPGCYYVDVKPGVDWHEEECYSHLRRPGYSLGAIFNPGGTKNNEIKFCRYLMFEDDGPGGLEDKQNQWEQAGLPRPSFQIWTGGKSVHHYWLLDDPCSPTDFKRGMKRLARHCQRALPGAGIDFSLSNASRILRMAGAPHPKTGEMARYLSAGGQRYSYEQLWNLTGEDNYVKVSAAAAAAVDSYYAPTSPPPPKAAGTERPDELVPLPDRDDPEFKDFLKQQLANDEEHQPAAARLTSFPRPRQLELIVEALPFCVERGPAGSGTYEPAFKILAAMVNHLGINDALQCAHAAGWSQEHWDIVDQAHKIEENSSDRDELSRVTIYHLFDSAELNGWIRPWRITKSKDAEVLDPEERAEMRAFRQLRIQEWMEARASNFTLADAFTPEIAEILAMRARAFPVSEVAMLPPFMAAMASLMGTRYRVEIKKGWQEPMVFWFGSVGPASSLKTPVANQVLHPLLEMDLADQVRYKQMLKEYKAQRKADRDAELSPPALPRKCVAVDATLEGLCQVMDSESTFGLLCHHDELVNFIASMDAYRGKGGPSKDRAHWLSMWSGQQINIIRKGADPVFVPATAVSVFGAVQQDKLTEMLHGDKATSKSGDGFWARFLWCVPCNPRPLMNRDETEINAELKSIAEAFDSLMAKPTVVHLGDEAWELFSAQCDRWTVEADQTYAARSAFLGKMRGYAARFAGFLHALDYVERIRHEEKKALHLLPREISGDVMRRALLLAQFFINQFDVLAPQVGGNEDLPEWVVKVVELASGREDRKVTVADLRKRKWGKGQRDRKEMLESLVTDYGLGRMLSAPRANQVWWELT